MPTDLSPQQPIAAILPADPDQEFWDDLFIHLESGKVIPIIGPDVITFGDHDEPLYPWLAAELAARLALISPGQPPPTNIQEVVDAVRARNGDLNSVYTKLYKILKEPGIQPGPSLLKLVALSPFKLFLTTAIDPLLGRAIAKVHPLAPGDPRLSKRERYITEAGQSEDLPALYEDLKETCVYHLLGRVGPVQDFVTWDDDAMHYLLLLDRLLPGLTQLSASLKKAHLLVIGLSLSDWLLRFLVYVVKQQRLSSLAKEYLYYVEQLPLPRRDEIVVYFSRLTKQVRIFSIKPRDFVAKLIQECEARFPRPDITPSVREELSGDCPPGAIFISYATPDVEAARRVYARLAAAGCVVWFDRVRIEAGEWWINSLKSAVDRCGLFLSLISANTDKRTDAYYISERNWAFKRRERIAERVKFYVPICIDGVVRIPANEPVDAGQLQAVLMPDGELSDGLVQALRKSQSRYLKAQNLPVPVGLRDLESSGEGAGI